MLKSSWSCFLAHYPCERSRILGFLHIERDKKNILINSHSSCMLSAGPLSVFHIEDEDLILVEAVPPFDVVK
jgi:hypothetical protein